MLTLVFATYALVLAPSLLVFGQLSDRLGRRRVMAAGFATATVGLVLFAVAGSLAWLFAARAVQGLAVGMISGAAAAALVELDPAPQEDRAALFAALAQAGGQRLRAADRGDAGRVGAGAARAAVRRVHRPGRRRDGRRAGDPGARARRRRAHQDRAPERPAEIRMLFVRVSLTGAAVWAVAAFFLSVVPSYAAELLDTSNLALLGAVSALMLATSCVAQIAARRATAYARMQAIGLLLLALGLVALVLAFPTRSLLVLLAAGLLAGAGHGVAFLGAPGTAQPRRPARPPRRGQRGLLHPDLPRRGRRGHLDRPAHAALLALHGGDGLRRGRRERSRCATAAWHVTRARRRPSDRPGRRR